MSAIGNSAGVKLNMSRAQNLSTLADCEFLTYFQATHLVFWVGRFLSTRLKPEEVAKGLHSERVYILNTLKLFHWKVFGTFSPQVISKK